MQENYDLDSALGRARAKRKRLVVGLSVVTLTAVVLYLMSVLLVKGIRVQILPSAATPSANINLSSGAGLVVGEQVYLLSRRGELTIKAPTFKSQTLLVDGSQSMLVVQLQPKPTMVEITTGLDNVEFDWFINDTWHSSGATFNSELEPGQYKIRASHPWFDDISQSVTAGRAERINKVLEPKRILGQATITSKPSGAAILLDGEGQGITPYSLSLEGGIHSVALSLDGFEKVEASLEISNLIPAVNRAFTLTPLQAVLELDLQPQDGILTINQQVVQKSAEGLISVDANTPLTIRYEKKGFVAWQQSLTLAPKQQRQETINLLPEMGKVKISSNVQADIMIDGKLVGKTPQALSLQALPVKIELTRSGYRTHAVTVTPSQAHVKNLNVTLLSEFDARRQEGKALFASKLGMQFVSVSGGRFTMGSAVNEADRQRDEHQIEVTLSTPFLVATTEVTEAQYHAFDASIAASQLPVTNVTWLDAVRYCNWLSEQEGLTPYYRLSHGQVTLDKQAKGYRLLSEAEWEFIAKHYQRAARTTFVWGSAERLSTKQGNFADETLKGKQAFFFENYQDGFTERAPVASFKADRNGFFDLDGNVREWVTDSYVLTPPESLTQENYVVLNDSASHVIKGASYLSGRLKMLRASLRGKGSDKYDDVGFRIARNQ